MVFIHKANRTPTKVADVIKEESRPPLKRTADPRERHERDDTDGKRAKKRGL